MLFLHLFYLIIDLIIHSCYIYNSAPLSKLTNVYAYEYKNVIEDIKKVYIDSDDELCFNTNIYFLDENNKIIKGLYNIVIGSPYICDDEMINSVIK